ncbi:hypothetical protein ABT150_17645 [Streptomyces mirabilis]|uniref:hypothetical protein n=1 Tax=Streptomyces mirabilis TaxID=68239 RepID=UPI00332D94E5
MGREDTVKAASPGVQDWLYECLPAPDGTAVTRMFTAHGWALLPAAALGPGRY